VANGKPSAKPRQTLPIWTHDDELGIKRLKRQNLGQSDRRGYLGVVLLMPGYDVNRSFMRAGWMKQEEPVLHERPRLVTSNEPRLMYGS